MTTPPTMTDPLFCEVCGAPAIGVAAVAGIPISVAWCQSCANSDVIPWWILVAETTAIGGIDQAADWWRLVADATCAHYSRTRAELDAAVAEALADEADYFAALDANLQPDNTTTGEPPFPVAPVTLPAERARDWTPKDGPT